MYFFSDLRNDASKQKAILDSIANHKNFDPEKEPQKWYTITRKDFEEVEVLNLVYFLIGVLYQIHPFSMSLQLLGGLEFSGSGSCKLSFLSRRARNSATRR